MMKLKEEKQKLQIILETIEVRKGEEVINHHRYIEDLLC